MSRGIGHAGLWRDSRFRYGCRVCEIDVLARRALPPFACSRRRKRLRSSLTDLGGGVWRIGGLGAAREALKVPGNVVDQDPSDLGERVANAGGVKVKGAAPGGACRNGSAAVVSDLIAEDLIECVELSLHRLPDFDLDLRHVVLHQEQSAIGLFVVHLPHLFDEFVVIYITALVGVQKVEHQWTILSPEFHSVHHLPELRVVVEAPDQLVLGQTSGPVCVHILTNLLQVVRKCHIGLFLGLNHSPRVFCCGLEGHFHYHRQDHVHYHQVHNHKHENEKHCGFGSFLDDRHGDTTPTVPSDELLHKGEHCLRHRFVSSRTPIARVIQARGGNALVDGVHEVHRKNAGQKQSKGQHARAVSEQLDRSKHPLHHQRQLREHLQHSNAPRQTQQPDNAQKGK
mmetsp:Transcript_14864/g.44113  ORF Transcript_14864/g.44113 Transcript_14864/m.44113 type:complete len:398 (-) Transcript_14864:525-1718(-)